MKSFPWFVAGLALGIGIGIVVSRSRRAEPTAGKPAAFDFHPTSYGAIRMNRANGETQFWIVGSNPWRRIPEPAPIPEAGPGRELTFEEARPISIEEVESVTEAKGSSNSPATLKSPRPR